MELRPFEWFQILASVAMFVAGVAVWLWGRDQAGAIVDAVSKQRLRELERRMERAGKETSDLASDVQGLATKADFDAVRHDIAQLKHDVYETGGVVSIIRHSLAHIRLGLANKGIELRDEH